MAITLPQAFETQLIKLCGWDPTVISIGTTQIDLVNIGGQTTVMATVSTNIDTKQLVALLQTTLTAQTSALPAQQAS